MAQKTGKIIAFSGQLAQILELARVEKASGMNSDDNRTWVIEAGRTVLEKEAATGFASLTAVERLVYCLWVADYGMTNAGDLKTAEDVDEQFQEKGLNAAQELALPKCIEAFSLARDDLERRYFQLFDTLCEEINGLEPRLIEMP
jgi:hypothetical protein